VDQYLSYDIGSISVKRVLLQDNRKLSLLPYTRHHGQPYQVILQDLENLAKSRETVSGLAFTGCAGKQLAGLLQAVYITEFEAMITGAKAILPQVKTIIEIGGEHSRFADLAGNDYGMNELCAAGTGSFLEQQASRFNLSIEEFSQLALRAARPATIAGRCSVFAKSDMIHLQQEGTPDEEIALGLCYALVRSFKAGIAKGKDFLLPIVFCGGVAFNRAIVKAFEETTGKSFTIPEHPESVSALGAALALKRRNVSGQISLFTVKESLRKHLQQYTYQAESLPELKIVSSSLPSVSWSSNIHVQKKVEAAIGIDVGSISTNVVALDINKNLLAKVYLRTSGRPIEAVRQGIALLHQQLGERIKIKCAGTTGSGRYLIGDLVGADTVVNEITAQATAAAHIDTSVDTIFEIGGQDSKYIYLKDGVVVDFEMNKICAAGTGSFLEEQAERFNLPIQDFGNIALQAKKPINLGERCTVFMETNVYAHYQKGASIPDILAGLAYSIVTNYLNRVVGRKKIGQKIFFQGAVAFNKAVVAAFEQTLRRPIIVPQHHEVTGAIGAALVALRNPPEKTSFRGFAEIAALKYQQSSFECQGCTNHCEIKKVFVNQQVTLFYGGRCEKYEVGKTASKNIPDFFSRRNNFLFHAYQGKNPSEGIKIGLPLAMLNYEFYPFWKAFFTELGFPVVFSEETNKKIISDGLSFSAAEFCFPVKVTLGHILNLWNKQVDYLFLPVIRDMPCGLEKIEGTKRGSYTCPYVQAISQVAKSCLPLPPEKVLDPVINFSYREYARSYQLVQLGEKLGRKGKQIHKAIEAAYQAQKILRRKLKATGYNLLAGLPEDKIALVVLGRPYNCCDRNISLDIPNKLRNLGFWTLPMDYLPLESADIFSRWPNLYWEFGYRMMQAVEIIKKDKRLYPVYITNFGCGPDSFLLQYLEREINKPFLRIEIDEHTAGAGIITRCEAFADSLRNFRQLLPLALPEEKKHLQQKTFFHRKQNRKIFIPYMGDASLIAQSAFRALGLEAEVMYADQETLQLGRKYTLGKECYPFILTTGDMLKTLKYNDPDKIAFFMPLTYGPCRFGQYNRLQRIILQEAGYEKTPILSPGVPESSSFAKACGLSVVSGWRFFLVGMAGVIALDYLGKMLRKIRPYELNPGQTETVYQKTLLGLCQIIENSSQESLRSLHQKIRILLAAAKSEMEKIPCKNEDRPLIGLVGEIYVRNHPFSNNEIIRKIESLGGQVLLPPYAEWAYHTNATTRLDFAVKQKDLWRKLATNLHKSYPVMRNIFSHSFLLTLNRIIKFHLSSWHLQIEKEMKDFLQEEEPLDIYPVWDKAEPYVLKWFGEAALSIGKALEWNQKGLDGVVNVLPFTCLPGNIVTAVSKKVKADHALAWINLAYDGLEQATSETRLEAFFYQARQCHLARRKSNENS